MIETARRRESHGPPPPARRSSAQSWTTLLACANARLLLEVAPRNPDLFRRLRAFLWEFNVQAGLEEQTRSPEGYLRWARTYLRTHPLPLAPEPADPREECVVLYDVLVGVWREVFSHTRDPERRRCQLLERVTPILQQCARQRPAPHFQRDVREHLGFLPSSDIFEAALKPQRAAARALLRALRSASAEQFVGRAAGSCLLELLRLNPVQAHRLRKRRRAWMRQRVREYVTRLRRLARHARDPEALIRARQALQRLS
jgi:hypothetical protein